VYSRSMIIRRRWHDCKIQY